MIRLTFTIHAKLIYTDAAMNTDVIIARTDH